MWEKEKLWRELVENKMSLIIWPKEEWSNCPLRSALMEVLESPSNMELEMPTSGTNWTTRLAASISRVRTKFGMGIFSAIAARTLPRSFQITTRKPAAFISLNMAPSILVLTPPWLGGFHRGLQGCTFFLGAGRDLWNSWRWICAKPAI